MASDNMTLKGAVWVIAGVLFFIVLLSVGFNVSQLGLDRIGPQVLQFVFLGTDDLNTFNVTGDLNATALLITALMIWLIIFVSFGDVLENFSAFSSGIGWIVAFAIAVIGANVKIINTSMVYLVGVFAWLGTFAIFAALFGAIFAFFAVNWGMSRFTNWIRQRTIMINAATGRVSAKEGLRTLKEIGKESAAR